MADNHQDEFNDVGEELRALSDVRAALEAFERQHDAASRQRRELRARLDALLDALRDNALTLQFDSRGELVDAAGPFEEHLGISPSDLLAGLETVAEFETVEALQDANRAVLGGEYATLTEAVLSTLDEQVAVTFVHVCRSFWEDDVNGVEAIGIVAPTSDLLDDDLGIDPFDLAFDQIASQLASDASDTAIEAAVALFGDFLDADRVAVNMFDSDTSRFAVATSWLRGGDSLPILEEDQGLGVSQLPWAFSLLGEGQTAMVDRSADLPAEADAELDLYAPDINASAMLVPMLTGARLAGFVSIQSQRADRTWNDADDGRARKFAAIVNATQQRAVAEDAAAAAGEQASVVAAGLANAEARFAEATERAEETQRLVDESAGRNEETGTRARSCACRCRQYSGALRRDGSQDRRGRQRRGAGATRSRRDPAPGEGSARGD